MRNIKRYGHAHNKTPLLGLPPRMIDICSIHVLFHQTMEESLGHSRVRMLIYQMKFGRGFFDISGMFQADHDRRRIIIFIHQR